VHGESVCDLRGGATGRAAGGVGEWKQRRCSIRESTSVVLFATESHRLTQIAGPSPVRQQ